MIPPSNEELARLGADPRRRIERYLLVDELGRGGMGVVFRAWDTAVERWVALKLLPPDLEPVATQRFLREGQALARVQHPGIVQVHGAGESGGRAWLAMALLQGGSFDKRLRDPPPLSLAAKLEIVRDAARALAHAHACGIVHRDVKPANLLLDRAGRALVTDFGLARFLDGRTRLTQTSETVGTPAYMPPEQIDGAGVDARADVYGLGATLYFALAGRPPFQRPTRINLIQAVLTERPDPPSRFAPGVPRELDALVLRCLEKDPADRWPDAASLADALDASLAAPPATLTPHGARPASRPVPSWAIAVTLLLGAGSFAGLVVWERATREHIPRAPAAPVPSAAPIASPFPPAVPVIEAVRAIPVREWRVGVDLLAVVWRPGTAQFAVAGEDHRVFTGELDDDSELVPSFEHGPDPTCQVHALASSLDGRYLATGGTDGRARVWDWDSGAPRGEHTAGAPAWHLAYSPEGQLALSVHAADKDVRLFASEDLKEWRSLLERREQLAPHPSALGWSADGANLAITINAHGDAGSRVLVVEVASGRVLAEPSALGAYQAGVLPEPETWKWGGWHFSGARFVAGDSLLAVGVWDSPRLLLWDLARGSWDYIDGAGVIGGPVLNSHGDLVLLGQHFRAKEAGSGCILGWSIKDRRRLFTVSHGSDVPGLAIIPGDPIRFISVGRDGRAVLWRLEDAR